MKVTVPNASMQTVYNEANTVKLTRSLAAHLTFLGFLARAQGGRGGRSELRAALRGHVCFGWVGFAFLVIFGSVTGHICYVTLQQKHLR